MSDTVIKVENLGKKYVIGHQKQERYTALRDVIAKGARSVAKKITNPQSIVDDSREDFWALKNVSFEIKQGDRVGIIGRNGAGKSTLLKILSRITEPTKGRIKIKGRVASLLEVGTGFHPELTGRENIFLNGAILGMSKAEIKKKFDEIVAFAEVEKFLDTPVKRYSSGMYVRLAFAVAAHLELEILVVDEVLAVGDAVFQKKCLRKMEEVGKEGKTVLFVSHNMATINQLCQKGILLSAGEVLFEGSVEQATSQYLLEATLDSAIVKLEPEQESELFFQKISILNSEGVLSNELASSWSFSIHIDYIVQECLKDVEIAIRIMTSNSIPVFTSIYSDNSNTYKMNKVPGHYTASVEIPGNFLMPSTYTLTCAAFRFGDKVFASYQDILKFKINDTGTKVAKYNHYDQMGMILVDFPWSDEILTSTTV